MNEAATTGFLAWMSANPTGMMLVIMGAIVLGLITWRKLPNSQYQATRIFGLIFMGIAAGLILYGVFTMVVKDELQFKSPPPTKSWWQ